MKLTIDDCRVGDRVELRINGERGAIIEARKRGDGRLPRIIVKTPTAEVKIYMLSLIKDHFPFEDSIKNLSKI